MLFGHLGITIGIIYLLFAVLKMKFSQRILAVTVVGAFLPDIIDKLIGQILFYDYFHNNRIFAHTFFFLVVLAIITAYMYSKGHKWAPILAAAAAVHLMLDSMWSHLHTLLWPMYGLSFEKMDLSNWANENINALLHNPNVYLPEIIGLVIFLIIAKIAFFPRVEKAHLVNISSLDKGQHKVSLVIPTMNEANNIPHVFSKIPQIVDEVVVVDSSKDKTVEAIKNIRPDAKIFVEEPKGKGKALKKGFEYATGDIVIMMDADGSMDPQEIPQFVKPLMDGYDAVKGSRILGGSDDLSLLRSFGNFCFVTLVNILYDTDYTDLCYGYRGFKKSALDKLKCASDGFDVETEQSIMMKKMGLKVCEVPSYEGRRIYGTSNLRTFGDGKKILMRILREKVAK